MRMAFVEDSWYKPQGYEYRLDLTTISRSNLRWY